MSLIPLNISLIVIHKNMPERFVSILDVWQWHAPRSRLQMERCYIHVQLLLRKAWLIHPRLLRLRHPPLLQLKRPRLLLQNPNHGSHVLVILNFLLANRSVNAVTKRMLVLLHLYYLLRLVKSIAYSAALKRTQLNIFRIRSLVWDAGYQLAFPSSN